MNDLQGCNFKCDINIYLHFSVAINQKKKTIWSEKVIELRIKHEEKKNKSEKENITRKNEQMKY